jgi:uncharacterized membrane protein YeaQ/YmgE (transglycosylase-associated protein family)
MFHQYGEQMSIIAWILLGLMAGLVSSRIVNRPGDGVLTDIFVGIVGALAGGFFFQRVGLNGITGLNLWSFLIATMGSILLLIAFHGIRRLGWSLR